MDYMRSALTKTNKQMQIELSAYDLYPHFNLPKSFSTKDLEPKSFAAMQHRVKNALRAVFTKHLSKTVVLCGDSCIDLIATSYELVADICVKDTKISIAYAPTKIDFFGTEKEEGIVSNSDVIIMPIAHLNAHPKWLGMIDAVLAQNDNLILVLCGDAADCAALSLYWSNYVNAVHADFVFEFRASEQNYSLAALIKHYVIKYKLKDFDGAALNLIASFLARLNNDRRYLFISELKLISLCQEANSFCKTELISEKDVLKAIAASDYRINFIAKAELRYHQDKQLLIKTKGECVGQINGLSVLETQGSLYEFGQVVRISATHRAGGEGDVIDIEHKAELAGQIHAKAMMIINGFLTKEFGSVQPLPVNASLVFEQSYSEIDGDSASLTGLCAVLSSLANLAIRQDIAVTGAVDQFGNVQSVGGVNEKIEAFFKVCSMHGLTGTQGVIIPSSCVSQLVLRPSVVKAVDNKKFHIYTVDSVQEAMLILTNCVYGDETIEDSVYQRIINNVCSLTMNKDDNGFLARIKALLHL